MPSHSAGIKIAVGSIKIEPLSAAMDSRDVLLLPRPAGEKNEDEDGAGDEGSQGELRE